MLRGISGNLCGTQACSTPSFRSMYGGVAACIDLTTGLSIFPYLNVRVSQWPRDVEGV